MDTYFMQARIQSPIQAAFCISASSGLAANLQALPRPRMQMCGVCHNKFSVCLRNPRDQTVPILPGHTCFSSGCSSGKAAVKFLA